MFGQDLVLTESQNKFKDDSDEFELVSFSKRPKVSTLNRQIILLLSSNGLSDDVIMNFVNREIKIWKTRMSNKLSLRKVMKRIWENSIGSNIKKVLSLQEHDSLDKECKDLACKIEGMPTHQIEFFYHVDPLLCVLCEKIMMNQCSNLKTNVPVDKCSLLMGVIDLYGVLEDDEVFIQLSPFESYERDLYESGSFAEGGIVSGDVFVTRSPCLHPGDIRKLKAISDPSRINLLKRHIRDVIVFSQKSRQPQASKMSGGDLDGDLFMVCWDNALLAFKEHPPMKHSQLKPIEKQGGFNKKAIRNFFIEYIANDNLGVLWFLENHNSCFNAYGTL